MDRLLAVVVAQAGDEVDERTLRVSVETEICAPAAYGNQLNRRQAV